MGFLLEDFGRRGEEGARCIIEKKKFFRPAMILHSAVQCRFTSLLLLWLFFVFFSGPGRSRTSQASTGTCEPRLQGRLGKTWILKENIIVVFGSKSKLWKDMSLMRAIQYGNMKYVDIARSPLSAIRVFSSSGRLANQLKINEIR